MLKEVELINKLLDAAQKALHAFEQQDRYDVEVASILEDVILEAETFLLQKKEAPNA